MSEKDSNEALTEKNKQSPCIPNRKVSLLHKEGLKISHALCSVFLCDNVAFSKQNVTVPTSFFYCHLPLYRLITCFDLSDIHARCKPDVFYVVRIFTGILFFYYIKNFTTKYRIEAKINVYCIGEIQTCNSSFGIITKCP